MSYPAINHMEIKLAEIAGGTRVELRHRAIGLIEKAHREGVSQGWDHMLHQIAGDVTGKTAAQK